MSRQNMDLVLNDGINTAVNFLEKNGEFFPFGVVKTKTDGIRHIQVMMDESRPASSNVSEYLAASLKEGGLLGSYTTVAIISDVKITDKENGHKHDAISVSIDDENSDPILCYVPYRIEEGIPILGEIKAGIGTRIAF